MNSTFHLFISQNYQTFHQTMDDIYKEVVYCTIFKKHQENEKFDMIKSEINNLLNSLERFITENGDIVFNHSLAKDLETLLEWLAICPLESNHCQQFLISCLITESLIIEIPSIVLGLVYFTIDRTNANDISSANIKLLSSFVENCNSIFSIILDQRDENALLIYISILELILYQNYELCDYDHEVHNHAITRLFEECETDWPLTIKEEILFYFYSIYTFDENRVTNELICTACEFAEFVDTHHKNNYNTEITFMIFVSLIDHQTFPDFFEKENFIDFVRKEIEKERNETTAWLFLTKILREKQDLFLRFGINSDFLLTIAETSEDLKYPIYLLQLLNQEMVEFTSINGLTKLFELYEKRQTSLHADDKMVISLAILYILYRSDSLEIFDPNIIDGSCQLFAEILSKGLSKQEISMIQEFINKLDTCEYSSDELIDLKEVMCDYDDLEEEEEKENEILPDFT